MNGEEPCYLAAHGVMANPRETMLPCSGLLVRAHLIPQQTLLREIIDPMNRLKEPTKFRALRKTPESLAILWDPRVWVWACGGPMGNGAHHGLFDHGRISLPRQALPDGLVEFAHQYGITWAIERRYGTTEHSHVR